LQSEQHSFMCYQSSSDRSASMPVGEKWIGHSVLWRRDGQLSFTTV